ncbi:MAG: hypothetical protein ACKOZU_01240 [Planctomycetaceae bacterium]
MHKTFDTVIDDAWLPEYRRQDWGIRRYLFSLYGFSLYLVPAAFVTSFILESLGVPHARTTILVVLSAIVTTFTIWFARSASLNRRSWEDFSRHFHGKALHWEVNDEGLRLTGPNGSTTGRWDLLREIHCYRSDWHLHFVGARIFLPVRFLDEEIRDLLVGLVQRQGVKVIIEGPCLSTRGDLPPVPATGKPGASPPD